MSAWFGPLKVPQVGREVSVELNTGETLDGYVDDLFEDGTGFVLGPWDEMVEQTEVRRWKYTDDDEHYNTEPNQAGWMPHGVDPVGQTG